MDSTILVADDEPGIVDVLAMVLEDAGYAVLRAHDGAEARAVLERERADLVIADIMMPGLSGLELAAWVWTRAADGQPPVVLISAVHRPTETLVPPAAAFLAKPFDLDAVEALVEALLPSPPPGP